MKCPVSASRAWLCCAVHYALLEMARRTVGPHRTDSHRTYVHETRIIARLECPRPLRGDRLGSRQRRVLATSRALHEPGREPDRRRGDRGGAQRSARTSGRRRARWSVLSSASRCGADRQYDEPSLARRSAPHSTARLGKTGLADAGHIMPRTWEWEPSADAPCHEVPGITRSYSRSGIAWNRRLRWLITRSRSCPWRAGPALGSGQRALLPRRSE